MGRDGHHGAVEAFAGLLQAVAVQAEKRVGGGEAVRLFPSMNG
jgi:hypothetical protein